MYLLKKQFAKFALSGTIGFVADSSVLYLLLAIGLGSYVGRAVSFLSAVFVTWRINRRHTFPQGDRPASWSEFGRYLLAMSAGGACNYAAYVLALRLVHAPPAIKPLLGVAVGSLAGMVVNFIGAKWWVFHRRRAA